MKSRLILGAACAALLTNPAGCALFTRGFRNDLPSTLQEAKPQLSQCYAEALKRNPKLAGSMMLTVTVQRSTTALTGVTAVGPQPADATFEQCVARVVGGLKVAKSPMFTCRANFPVNFTPAP